MTLSRRVYKALVLVYVVGPFLGTIYAMVLLWERSFFWSDLVLLVTFTLLVVFGINIGYHRMLTHDGFKCPAWLKGPLLIFGCMGYEGGPIEWAARHTEHHAFSDQEGDPHSPLDGFWHAHFGWIYSIESSPDMKKYTPHLFEDPVVVFVQRTTLLWMALAMVVPFLIGGWTGLLWGGIVRLFITTHVTWSVNSVCHTFGRRDYETTDESRNNWIVGLLAFGEGWHNNHHAFPRNAFHGMEWWQFDLAGLVIRFWEKVGIVWDVQRVSSETRRAHRARAVQRRAALAALRSQLAASIEDAQRRLDRIIERAVDAELTPQTYEKIQESCDQAKDRLTNIQSSVAKASNLKAQKLREYSHEVQELVGRVQAVKA